jgi:hypothetical protein
MQQTDYVVPAHRVSRYGGIEMVYGLIACLECHLELAVGCAMSKALEALPDQSLEFLIMLRSNR